MGTSRDISEEANNGMTGGQNFDCAEAMMGRTAHEERFTHTDKGGMYRLIGPAQYKKNSNKDWKGVIIYQDVSSKAYYVTGPERWNEAFEVLPGPGYVNQD